MLRTVLLSTIFALPITARAEPGPDLANQFAASLTSPDDGHAKASRTPKLGEVKAAKTEAATARTTDAAAERPAEPWRLADGQHVATTPAMKPGLAKVEGNARTSTFAPVPTNGPTRAMSVRHPHRATVASFEVGTGRSHLDELVRSWKTDGKWDAIVVDAYSFARGRSAGDNARLAQRDADEIRAYLIQHGIPAGSVIAVGHEGEASDKTRARVDISATAKL